MSTGRIFKILVFEGGDEPKVEVTVPLKLSLSPLSITMPSMR